MKHTTDITRRDFLRGTAGLILGTALGTATPSEGTQKARVVVIRNEDILDEQNLIRKDLLKQALDEALQTLTGGKTPIDAWGKMFSSGDIVGVKTNVWRYLSTPREMEDAITGRLVDIGIPSKSISVDDRGVRVNTVFQNATAFVNVRPVRTHHWSGVGTCLKNYIMFVPVPSEYHDNGCAELGKIWTLPHVKGRTRLNILVALTPQFYGRGAHSFDRRYVWPYKGLIVGTDPVAVDAVGAELLRLKRVSYFGNDRDLDVQPNHIMVADTKYRLGVSDLKRIEIVRLGWAKDFLV